VPFRPTSSGLVLTGIVDTPLPSLKYFPRPSSSLAHKCTLRCPIPRIVSNAKSKGCTSLQANFDHRPLGNGGQYNSSPLFEFCTKVVTNRQNPGRMCKRSFGLTCKPNMPLWWSYLMRACADQKILVQGRGGVAGTSATDTRLGRSQSNWCHRRTYRRLFPHITPPPNL